MGFQTGKICNTGGRNSNQDYADSLILENAACWVAADGLGGHVGGEVASKTAVEKILESFKKEPECSPQAIGRYLEAAQEELLRLQEEKPRLSRMRTTIVIVVSDFEHFLWGHVGDARFYLLRSGSIRFQTKDHSVPQAMVNAEDISFDQIRHHEDRNRLLRSLGQQESFRPEIPKEMVRLADGDVFLLCTDGFWEYVLEEEMEVDFVKANTPEQWLQKMESRILRRAEGEFDNYTAIAVYYTVPQAGKIKHKEKVVPVETDSIVRKVPPDVPAVDTAPVRGPYKSPEKKSKKTWILVLVILLAFAAGGVFMKWVMPKLTDFFKKQSVLQKVPASPNELAPGQIYLKNAKQYDSSLENAWNKAVENEEIWLPAGYFLMEFKGNEKKLTVKGSGNEKTLLFIKMRDIDNKTKIERHYVVKLALILEQLYYNVYEVDNLMKSSGEISIILIDYALRIIRFTPPINPDRKETFQNALNCFPLFNMFNLTEKISKDKNNKREKGR